MADKLVAARERAGLSPAAAAVAVGKGGLAVYRWERGLAVPDFATLEKLAAAYGVTVGQLVDGVPPKKRGTR